MYNFKQYYGEETVHFAGSQAEDQKNVTVIYGANGRGKTTIYRALMVALFGLAELSKDKEFGKKGDKYYICNLNAMQEDTDGAGIARVKVVFTHQGERYEIERVVASQLFKDGQVEEDFLSARLVHTDKNGRTNMYDREDEIASFVNQIFDRRMKDYFLFDGERIEQLMRDDQSQKKEVSKGIRNLLKLDALEDSVQAVSKLYANYQQEIIQAASGEYQTKLAEQQSKEKALVEKEAQLAAWREEIEAKERSVEDMDAKLKENRDLSEKVVAREQLTQQLKSLSGRKAEHLKKMREMNKTSFNLLMKHEYNRFYSEIELVRANLSNPYDIARELLEQILSDGRCAVCDTEFGPDSKQQKAVRLLLDKHQDYAYTREINDLKEEVRMVMERNRAAEERIQELLKEYKQIDNEQKRIQRAIETINEEIGESPNVDFRQIQQARDNAMGRIAELRDAIRRGTDEVERIAAEKRELDLLIAELEKKEAQKDTKVRMKEIAQTARDALRTIQNKFISEISREVERETTAVFRQFIDEESRKNLKEVRIEKDFSLQVLAWNGADFLPNLSSGQRQILSLSFIISLLRISGGTDDLLEIPLFMDTPFGRISGENRDNLLRLIPDMTPQWILLATDTEFTHKECIELRKTGRWGEVYRLVIPEPGKTNIVQDSVLGFQPER